MNDSSTQPDPRITLIDTHAHLASNRFQGNLEAVIERSAKAGVESIITAGTTADDSQQGFEIAARFPAVKPAVAIHPNDVADRAEGDWERILLLADYESVVAIGETGLDRYWKQTPFEIQVEFFNRHLELAARKALPVIIHCRDCYPDLIQTLKKRQAPIAGVLHSFTGTRDDAEALLELGLHLSFAGMVTFKNRNLQPLRDIAAWVPADRILVETDSPYLSPHPLRGKPNEPGNVALTARLIAELRGQSLADFAALTTQNARNLFNLTNTSSPCKTLN